MAILKILNDGYHNNQVICPDILYDLLHSWPSIHTISCKYSHADKSYINFEFSVVAIFIFLMEAITKSGDMSTHLVWFGIQLTINTHIFMQIFTCITKLYKCWVFSGGHFENSKWRSLHQPDHVSSFLMWF